MSHAALSSLAATAKMRRAGVDQRVLDSIQDEIRRLISPIITRDKLTMKQVADEAAAAAIQKMMKEMPTAKPIGSLEVAVSGTVTRDFIKNKLDNDPVCLKESSELLRDTLADPASRWFESFIIDIVARRLRVVGVNGVLESLDDVVIDVLKKIKDGEAWLGTMQVKHDGLRDLTNQRIQELRNEIVSAHNEHGEVLAAHNMGLNAVPFLVEDLTKPKFEAQLELYSQTNHRMNQMYIDFDQTLNGHVGQLSHRICEQEQVILRLDKEKHDLQVMLLDALKKINRITMALSHQVGINIPPGDGPPYVVGTPE